MERTHVDESAITGNTKKLGKEWDPRNTSECLHEWIQDGLRE